MIKLLLIIYIIFYSLFNILSSDSLLSLPKEEKEANLPVYLKASSAAVGLPLLSKAPLS